MPLFHVPIRFQIQVQSLFVYDYELEGTKICSRYGGDVRLKGHCASMGWVSRKRVYCITIAHNIRIEPQFNASILRRGSVFHVTQL